VAGDEPPRHGRYHLQALLGVRAKAGERPLIDSARTWAADAAAEGLVDRGEPIAVEQLARHPQLFPSFTAPPVADLSAS